MTAQHRSGADGFAVGPDRTLVLVRHARAEHTAGKSDVLRALAPAGRRDAPQAGAWLARLGVAPDIVLCSSAQRARQTCRLLLQGLGSAAGADPEVRHLEELYAASPSDVLQVVRAVPAASGTVLVVGHEPTMSATALRLAGPHSRPEPLAAMHAGYPTNGVAVLGVACEWADLQPDGAALLHFSAPRG